jgi:predicted RNA-binding protein with PIN domain
MQEIIIDGCNLAHKVYGASGEKERSALVRKLKDYCGRKRIKVTIVFDSSVRNDLSRVLPNLKVRYAPAPADNCIVTIVRTSRKRKTLTVISDDRTVGEHVRSLGAKRIGTTAFFDSLKIGAAAKGSPANEKPSSETPEGMKRYLDLWKEGFNNDSY